MKRFTREEQIFIELVKYGVWKDISSINTPLVSLLSDRLPDECWKRVLTLSEEQTVVGIVADVLSSLPAEMRPSKSVYFGCIAQALEIETNNKKLNEIINQIFAHFQENHIYCWLQKGQGVACWYPNPLLRQSGDIDLLIPFPADYNQVKTDFEKHFEVVEQSKTEQTFMCRNSLVELHSQVVAGVNGKCKQNFRTLLNRYTHPKTAVAASSQSMLSNCVTVAPLQYDVVYVFMHMFRHFIGGGIGLRQIIDWMRILYCGMRDKKIDQSQLEADLHLTGLTKAWRIFGNMCVDYLGMPVELMPFYDVKYHHTAGLVLSYVLEYGNFGQTNAATHTESDSRMVKKAVAFLGHWKMVWRNLWIFPQETLYTIPEYLKDGLRRV